MPRCGPRLRVREMFRITASAPYIPPLLIMCRIFIPPYPHAHHCQALFDSKAPKASRKADPPAALSQLLSSDTDGPGGTRHCCLVEQDSQSTPVACLHGYSAAQSWLLMAAAQPLGETYKLASIPPLRTQPGAGGYNPPRVETQ